ncbi:MAG: hypothetical protein H6737_07545 [Alphaproteobacteria bacterium]|nr:hypothetical protein [Alphaproteobacteria bacterium]
MRLVPLALCLAACTGGGFVSVPAPGLFVDTGFRGDDDPPESVEAILQNPCAVCHSDLLAAGQLNLLVQPRENLVNERAVGNPTMFRVVPGDPDASYLVHKLRGTHLEVGGTGERMPGPGYADLQLWQIQMVEEWIRDGAPPFQ